MAQVRRAAINAELGALNFDLTEEEPGEVGRRHIGLEHAEARLESQRSELKVWKPAIDVAVASVCLGIFV